MFMQIKKLKLTIKGTRLSGHLISNFKGSTRIQCVSRRTQEMPVFPTTFCRRMRPILCELNNNGLVDIFVPDLKSSYYLCVPLILRIISVSL